MLVQNINERDEILGVVWLSTTEQTELIKYVDGVLATSGAVLKCSLNTGVPFHSICHGHKASTFAAKMFVPRVAITSVR
jgi:hypothetical protein